MSRWPSIADLRAIAGPTQRASLDAAEGKAPAPAATVAPTMTATEEDYHRQLLARVALGELRSVVFEGRGFYLADDCTLTPDFLVVAADGVVEAHEVKGAYAWEDSRIKVKWAASVYRDVRWFWAQRRAKRWTVRRRLAEGWARP